MDCSPRDSSVHGIFQARILEWVAISYFRDLPNPGIEPASPALGGRFLTTEPPGKPSMEDVRGYMRLMNVDGSARDGKKSDLESKRPKFPSSLSYRLPV